MVKYQIVGEDEADLKQGLINISSPIARALIGKEEGDTAEVQAPGGLKRYEIVAVQLRVSWHLESARSRPGRRALVGQPDHHRLPRRCRCCSRTCPPPAMAGQMAARLFTAQTWVSLGCGCVLLMSARVGR